MVAFEVAFAIGEGLGVGAAVVVYFSWPNAPIWAYSTALGVGFVISLVIFLRIRPKFKCPQCGKELRRDAMFGMKEGEPIRFVCSTCQIKWESGMSVTRGGGD